MSNKLVDLTGQKINYLTVIKRADSVNSKTMWHCKCDCGTELIVWAGHLRGNSRTTKSCRNCLYKRLTKHGKAQSQEYKSWKDMKSRCDRVKNFAYKHYGGRGITYCKEWKFFDNFFKDMGKAPTPKHTLDRINVNGNYEPSNCRWATKKEQTRNQRRNKIIKYNGEEKCLAEWCELLNLNYAITLNRLNRGWNVEDAFKNILK